MTYLLDTDIVINHLHNSPTLADEIRYHSVGISVITYGELLYGIQKKNSTKEQEKFNQFIQETSLHILPVTQEVMDISIQNEIHLESKGIRLDEFDLLIAATAIHHNLILVTQNHRHFERIPLLSLY